MLFQILCLVLAVLAHQGVAIDERILQSGYNGTSAVLLTVAYLEQSTVFSDDNGMIRRIAYVETRDGTRGNENIWAVSEEALQLTQNLDHPTLNVKYNLIAQELDIEWISVTFDELRAPLYSALAARLLLFLVPERIPDSNDIEGQAQFWKEYYNITGSVAEYVGAAYELEGNVLESSSSQFIFAFGRNDAAGITSATLRLFISSTEPNPVPVTVESLTGFTFTGIATNNETLTVEIPNTFQVFSSIERDKGLSVTAEGQSNIVVYGLNYFGTTSDAFLALPCDRLPVDQYEYYAISYSHLSHMLIVACEDDTVVQMGLDSIELNRMETYLLESDDDITGTMLVSNRPLVVYSGHRCANIPNGYSACDHLTEQVPPTAIWGANFISASFSGRSSGDLYRILASQSDTTATVNCSTFTQPSTYNLATPGSWQEFSTPDMSFCSITSNKPLLVMQFGLGNDFDGIGDPFMMMITPVEQYSNNYIFDVLPEFSTNYITIYVTPEDFRPQDIIVDGANLENADWTAVYCSNIIICGYITYVTLTPGEHRLHHVDATAHVGVSAYGFNSYNSYGYPGGLQLEPIQLATISFSQSEFLVMENEELVRVQLVRSGDTSKEVVVLIASQPYLGSAAADRDYEPIVEILTFEAEEMTKSVDIHIIDDTSVEFDENFFIQLKSGAGVHLSPFSRAEVIIRNDDGELTLSPRYGSELGGTPIIVSGLKLTVDEGDNVTCIFDSIETQGLATKTGQVLCVSPELTRTGRLTFELRVKGEQSSFTGFAKFRSVAHDKTEEVKIDNDLVITNGTMLRLHWTPENILPIENRDSYNVDIMIRQYNKTTRKWTVTDIVKDVPNTGDIEVAVPQFDPPKSEEDSASPAVIQIGVSESTSESQRRKRGFFSNIAKAVIRAVGYLTRVVILVTYPALELIRRAACELWGLTQSRDEALQTLSSLPACPCTVAAINGGDFEEEGITSVLFHPQSDKCFRERKRSSAREAGQQCCYDRNGNIIVGQDSGGTVDFVAPTNIRNIIEHFFVDVLPHIACCTPILLGNCGKYYEFRPSDDCSRTRPPQPAFARGDPHLVTLDGLRYTFNGRGEYTLIQTTDNLFTLQGRMTVASGVNETTVAATVFSALVGRDNNSDIVQLEVDVNSTLTAIVSGELVVFDIAEQEFEKVTIKNLGNNAIEVLFESGVYFVARVENGFISYLQVILPESYKGLVQGLLGNYNEDISDDLLPQFGDTPLPPDADAERIHNKFGVTWIVDSARRSLFSYQAEESWNSFYDPYFIPSYEPTFTSPELESRANNICGDDKFCLFDIATTGDVEVGLSTFNTSKEIDEIYNHLLPVVCDPPCDFGACVANDTCICSEGYSGGTCSEIVELTCEENICENGGSCSRHINDLTCDCLSGFTGFLCEELEGVSDADDTVAIVISLLVIGLLITCGVIVAIVVLRNIHVHRQKYKVTTKQEFDPSEKEVNNAE